MPDAVLTEAVNGPDGAPSGVLLVTFNRPDKLNAIDGALDR